MASSNSDPSLLKKLLFRSGCLWMLVTMLLSGTLLFLNAIFCISVYYSFVAQLPQTDRGIRVWLESSSVSQLIMFVLPVVMLAVQWLLLDALKDQVIARYLPDQRKDNS